MTDLETILAERLQAVRAEFDHSFAEPVEAASDDHIDFISIRMGEDAYAIRMTQIAGLYNNVKISPCPSALAEFRGLAGFRGALTPVYDLAALLGYPASSGQWMILAGGETLALSFDTFENHFRIRAAAVSPGRDGSAGSGFTREIARLSEAGLPVIDIPSVVAAIRARLPQTANKE